MRALSPLRSVTPALYAGLLAAAASACGGGTHPAPAPAPLPPVEAYAPEYARTLLVEGPELACGTEQNPCRIDEVRVVVSRHAVALGEGGSAR